jgi:uncharacterized membrane protein
MMIFLFTVALSTSHSRIGASGPKVTCLFGLFGETGSSILIWFNKIKKKREREREKRQVLFYIYNFSWPRKIQRYTTQKSLKSWHG